jgi:hypothetical protein
MPQESCITPAIIRGQSAAILPNIWLGRTEGHHITPNEHRSKPVHLSRKNNCLVVTG